MDQPALKLQEVRVILGDRLVLDRFSLAVQRGKVTALIGPNGSGKTTLMRCAAGILAPSAGKVMIDGIDMALDPVGARHRLGYVVDPARLPAELTGRQCLSLFAQARQLTAIPDSTMALALAFGFAPWIDIEVAFYSLGTRQKLAILLGLLGSPLLVLLDEPGNGLDPASAAVLREHLVELARTGTAVLMATHALESAERLAHRVLLLVDGRIRCDWDEAALADVRRGDGSLESAMIAALRENIPIA